MRHRCDRGLPRGALAWCSNTIPDGPLRRLLGILALSCHGSNLTRRSLQGSEAVQSGLPPILGPPGHTGGEGDRGQAVNADKMTQDETEVPRNHPPGIDLSALP